MNRKEARKYLIERCNPLRETGTKWYDAIECAIKALEEVEQKEMVIMQIADIIKEYESMKGEGK